MELLAKIPVGTPLPSEARAVVFRHSIPHLAYGRVWSMRRSGPSFPSCTCLLDWPGGIERVSRGRRGEFEVGISPALLDQLRSVRRVTPTKAAAPGTGTALREVLAHNQGVGE